MRKARAGSRRTTTALVAAGATLTLLTAGCAVDPAGAGGGGGGEYDPDEEVTLRLSWWGEADRNATTDDVVADFMTEHPNITVETEPSDFESYFDKIATSTAASDAPDVMALGGAYPLEYGAKGALVDLGTLGEQLDMSAFNEAALSGATYEDAVYGAPTGGNAIGLLANPRIFEEAGVELPDDETWTWDEFADLAAEISDEHPDDDTYGFEMQVTDILGSYAGQRGTGIYDWDGQLAVDTDTLVDFWDLELGLVESGAQPSAEVTTEFQGQSPELTLMGTGKAAMGFVYSNLLGTYADASGDDLVLLKIPGEQEFEHPGVTVLPSQYWAVSSQSEHPEASALLVDYLVNSPEAGSKILADRGLPFNTEVFSAIEGDLSPKDAESGAYVQEIGETAEPAPPQPEGGSILNDTTILYDSEVLFGTMTPQEAAEAWTADMSAALE
ncbi:extracellular solute-binding protein [Promicromonospora sp. MEB111]|uniref:ABC transporter substrate-binding protein n=1 Tax=unclassified Promicromonospora TaxID=2647929 RepID=UPI00254B7443|nr:extracellular solute-binding protein [Promicromonospora sp. MEB111]